MLSWKILLILIFCLIDYGKTVVINCIAYTAEANSLAFDAYIDGFNQYAKDNNLDIKVELNLMTMNSNYDSLGNSYLMIESLLKKGSSKYDIYFYDVSYLKQYSPYLIDLKEVLPEEHIYMYDEQILDQICTYDGKILGLILYIFLLFSIINPFSIWIDALYSNINLLNEYNKRVPKTWDELLETGKEILEKEKTLKNNTELVGYNGLMFDADNGLCSIYEFIYSCRETYESPFPELTSENTIKATKLIKKIKDELSSDEIFRTNTVFDVNLFEKNALFMKFWVFFGVLHNDNYVLSILPGMKEGISGSALIGYNIGISKNIQKDKKDAAIKAVEFMTSKGFQKKLVLQEIIISGILSLYDDEEVCSSIKNCEVYKDVQLIAKPVNKTDNYIEYSEKFTNYFYGYLYGNSTETEESVLKKIDDLTKIYHIAMDSKETSSGLTFFILFLVTIIMMIFSLIFLFIKKFEKYFSFLSKLDWIIIVIGIIIIAVSNFYNFGELTDFKCQMKNSLLALGFTFIYGPILCQLIINFPETNKYSF
ncbi:periplasmic binding protein-like II, partial [Anaeromyces robustus]